MIKVVIVDEQPDLRPPLFAEVFELSRANGEPIWKYISFKLKPWFDHSPWEDLHQIIEAADFHGLPVLDGRGVEFYFDDDISPWHFYKYEDLPIERALNGCS